MTAAYRRVHESTGLTMSAIGGWPHVISFGGQTERTNVTSVVCVAFFDAANAMPRSATFGVEVLGGVDSFSLDKLRSAHERFPALHDVVVKVKCWNVVPGLQLLLSQLAGYTSITSLNLPRQGLASFPVSFCALIRLKKLYLEGNKIVALPDAIGDLKELTDLNVSGNLLTALPETLGTLTGLTELRAGSNELTTLPDSIAALTQMKKLKLNVNMFTTFPKPIVKLTSLTELSLTDNQLATLPDWIAALTTLEILYLEGNRFTTFPKPIVKLTSLTLLLLDSNQLVTIPDEIAALTALKKLGLGFNQLVTLPDSIAFAARCLHTLFLSGNPLAKPQSSAVEAWLTALDAGGCYIEMPDEYLGW